jgi:hypothetical protein
MSDYILPPDGQPKQRKLDELFADEPFLSPTMKASRLHEKLQEMETRGEAAQGLPTEAFVAARPPGPARSEGENNSAALLLPANEMVGLVDAADYLRASFAVRRAWSAQGRISPGCAARLHKFHEGTLVQWLKGIGRRA